MNGVLTTVVSTLIESWQELRVHRGRVVLSLVGVTIAVASLAVVVGFGALAEKSTAAISEGVGGRPATFAISATSSTGGAVQGTDRFFDELRAAARRHDVRWSSEMRQNPRKVQFPDGVSEVRAVSVDPAHGEMHRLRMTSGRWFSEQDASRRAPAIVVNRAFLDRLGVDDLASHPTVRLPGAPVAIATVIGAYSSGSWDTEPTMYTLARSPGSDPVVASSDAAPAPTFELWIPERGGKGIAEQIANEAEQAFGADLDVSVERTDAAGKVEGDQLGPLRAVIASVSVLVLVLGGLGLLNVSLVSVRQRIREIGVRRGVGASAGRIFVAVLLENVLGTAVAGGVGVMLGAAILGNDGVRKAITSGVEVGGAPFPLDAALIGIGAALGVGVLAGVLPALLAVRVKVIDAIRY